MRWLDDSSHTNERHAATNALIAEWEQILRERHQLDVREAALIAELASTGVITVDSGHTASGWLAEHGRMPLAQAKQRVRVMERTAQRFRTLFEAFEQGRVSWHHVALFDRVANRRVAGDLVDMIPALVDLAEVATFDRWAQELRGIVEQLDQDGGYDPARDPSNNELRLTPLADGYTSISGRLVGELALLVRTLIDAGAEEVLARHRNDITQTLGNSPTADEVSDALTNQMPSRSQANAEALAEMLERAAGVPDNEGKVVTPECVVIFDQTTGELTDSDGGHLSGQMMRWVLAAAFIRPLELTGTGDPLRVGRLLRYANRHQRRALAVRDGGCVFPGCTRPTAMCDAHHVDHWDDDGPTDIENMALLCRNHHRVTHRPGWAMRRRTGPDIPDAMVLFEWLTPRGQTIYSQRHHTRIKLELPPIHESSVLSSVATLWTSPGQRPER